MNIKKTKEQKREQLLQRIKGFHLLDNDFMTKCFENNVEVQRTDRGAEARRARYHSSLIDVLCKITYKLCWQIIGFSFDIRSTYQRDEVF